MDSLTVDLTYGQALFDAAEELGKTSEIDAEYKAVSKVFSDNPKLKKLFIIPTIPVAEKKQVAEKVFKSQISQELFNFICILIDKYRVDAWDGIGRQYEKLVWEKDGLTKGILYSVIPVEKKRLTAFEKKVGKMFGKEVKLENRIDKSFIGGVRIYADGKLIDASVKTRLENMKQRIGQ